MSTGSRIQNARKKANLSQKELGEKLGVSASMIGQYENDLRKPKTETLAKIADALGINPWELRNDHMFYFEDFAPLKLNSTIDQIVNSLAKLNDEGQQKAVERVDELTEIPKYKKDPPQD